jgi:hypothetical protein
VGGAFGRAISGVQSSNGTNKPEDETSNQAPRAKGNRVEGYLAWIPEEISMLYQI